ncbi:hypothetical protein ACFFKU_07310 [Kineococcus gynurae]|uniref:Transglutaminase superfamily protein n=1 Tax=Kineococcus gynurae TaxID=452979 RepID=A0ABV5LWP0_9ACTN
MTVLPPQHPPQHPPERLVRGRPRRRSRARTRWTRWARRWVARRAHLTPSAPVAAWWADRALRTVRRELPTGGTAVRAPAPPPGLPESALVTVEAVLRRRRATCLQRCLVVQAWLGAHGRDHDVVVAVHARDGFGAHAWLADHDEDQSSSWQELTRLPARAPRVRP